MVSSNVIEIIQPKYVIAMGSVAYRAVCFAYDQKPRKPFKEAIGKQDLSSFDLFVVAHCSGLGKRNRSFAVQKEDWREICEN